MPDLNSVPPSPHVLARRPSSQQMPPPPVPSSPSMNILPSNQNAVSNTHSSSSALTSPSLPTPIMFGSSPPPGDNTGVGPGPGPMRHPRPMTAADLHLELEKEQEAVVNRLTRELSILRAAQNSSVISNASSTSASMSGAESIHLGDHHLSAGLGFSHPQTQNRRHQRTASNASARSITANAGSASVTSISSPAPIRPGQPALGGISLSRQNSAASRRSRAGSPSPAPYHFPSASSNTPSQNHTPSHSYTHSHLSEFFAQRHQNPSVTSVPTGLSALPTPSSSELSPGLLPATSRYEETAFYRAELDSVKRENEALKRKVRELERLVRERRASDASRASNRERADRTRSESVSTTASVSVAASTTGGGTSIAAQREREAGAGAALSRVSGDRPRVVSMQSFAGSVGVGVPEEEVKVGESAATFEHRAHEVERQGKGDEQEKGTTQP